MKPVSEKTVATLEAVAADGAKQIQSFFAYEGTNSIYFNKAKVGAVVIGAYARLRASETNRMAVELMAGRQMKQIAG